MNWVRTIVREVLGLFVDDGSFAAAILVWLLLVGLVSPHLGIAARWEGIVLFAGLALILAESAVRRSRR